MFTKASLFLMFTAIWLSGCESKISTLTPVPPPQPVGVLTAEFKALEKPNAYSVILKWKGTNQLGSSVVRTESGSQPKEVLKLQAVDYDFEDTDIIAGETYEYFVKEAPLLPRAKIRIPIDYVASLAQSYQAGTVTGYHRLFIGQWFTHEPIHVEVDEIVSVPFTDKDGKPFDGWIDAGGTPLFGNRKAPDGVNGIPGRDVFIRAKRIRGTIGIRNFGQDGGKGDTAGGASGAIDIKIEEPSLDALRITWKQALNGKYLGTEGFEKDRLAPLKPVQISIGKETPFTVERERLPLGVEGVYQAVPTMLLTPEGLAYDLIEEPSGALTTRLRENVREKGFSLSHTSILVGERLPWIPRLPAKAIETYRKTFRSLIGVIAAYGKLKHALSVNVTLALTLPPTLEKVDDSLTAFLEALSKKPLVLEGYLKRHELNEVTVALEKGSDFKIEERRLLIPQEVAAEPSRLLEQLGNDTLTVKR